MKRIREIALTVLFFCAVTIWSSAQNNIYGIADNLYEIYAKTEENKTDSMNLILADQMETLSIHQGDKKAECIANCIRTMYYAFRNNASDKHKMARVSQKLREVARRNGYLTYFYFSYLQECTYLLQTNNTLEAISLGQKMQEDAHKDNDPYGIYSCHTLLGNIYNTRNSLFSALHEFESALKFILEKMPEQSPGEAYRNCSTACILLGDNDKAIQFAQDGIKHPLTQPIIQTQLLTDLCIAYFNKNDYKEFEKTYSTLGIMHPETMPYDIPLNAANAMSHIVKGRYDKAEQIARQIDTDQPIRYKILSQIERARGNISQAMSYADSSQNVILRNFDNSINDDLLTLSAAIENAALRQSNYELERTYQQGRMRVLGTIVTLIALGIAVIFIQHERALRRTQKSNKELEAANKHAVEMQHRAEHSEQMKMLFIQNMSHEIRTPLNAICGFSQIVSEPSIASTLSEDDMSNIRSLISSNTEQLTTLIDDLLGLSDLESGKYKISLADTPVNALCQETLSSVSHRKPYGVDMIFETDIDDTVAIYTDKHRLRQVVTNLLTNACKHTDKGSITLRCSQNENPGHITISVTDTGEGIPADKAEVIFDRFEKLDTFKQGTGLGLPICRLIAEALKSKIFLDTNYTSGGARFVFITQDMERPDAQSAEQHS